MVETYSQGYALTPAFEPTIERETVEVADRAGTQTAVAVLTEEVGFQRSRAQRFSDDVAELHERTRTVEWRIRTGEVGKKDPVSILRDLSELGFAWSDVARMVGVSVPAVQKWRKGERCTGDNRQQLAALVAMCGMLTEHYQVYDIASWFEMPVAVNVRVTPMDLYVAGRPELVIELAGGHLDPEAILTKFDPDWRERYVALYETYRAEDGILALRPISK